ncbi:MAG: hypothetical protein COU47_01960 [Candidatus Niyogibacteria bacterium CG10_big_fil_rev_8_21_14_0_10_46_36]|uniref:Uncharacterized protein n=1 Tax=Candidatus Niyogibacteria bacterium CG10_big_fil_rev_8_21_14_0_10_46_36 TaxID=1974726 RepID=A0A2H0TDK8_9BACT|nr:MAG: hypothetical protein COU47_01960 [Candidatus Niyogibacteria bacterium CG10_big_fil_rev_8_21_14_0_10_46_36]
MNAVAVQEKTKKVSPQVVIKNYIMNDLRALAMKAFLNGKGDISCVSYEITTPELAKMFEGGLLPGIKRKHLQQYVREVLCACEDKKEILLVRDGKKAVRRIQFRMHFGEHAAGICKGKQKTILRKKNGNDVLVERIKNGIQRPAGRFIFPKSKKRGEAHEACNKGDRNEMRFYQLISLWCARITFALKELGVTIRTQKSGRHRPEAGLFDRKDKAGEDVDVLVFLGKKRFWFIFDVKSSRSRAKDFNKNIFLTKHQKDATLKRAILVNDERSDDDIIKEVIRHIARATTVTLPLY